MTFEGTPRLEIDVERRSNLDKEVKKSGLVMRELGDNVDQLDLVAAEYIKS
jgi:hypothetical protein